MQNTSSPKHIAIIMDGNGRWATQRGLPRSAGHKKGVNSLRDIVKFCAKNHIEILTVFAFSSENWKRPRQEVELLMDLFISALKNEVNELNKNNVVLKFIGDRHQFPKKLVNMVESSEKQTESNSGLNLFVAANYGGRWDIINACRKIADDVNQGKLDPADINETEMSRYLVLSGYPQPDLFIRTGGEQRISNFLLWQCAYSELYFCEDLWPDFNEGHLQKAIEWYEGRQRRFGLTMEQLEDK